MDVTHRKLQVYFLYLHGCSNKLEIVVLTKFTEKRLNCRKLLKTEYFGTVTRNQNGIYKYIQIHITNTKIHTQIKRKKHGIMGYSSSLSCKSGSIGALRILGDPIEFVLGRSGVKTSSQLQTSLEGIIVNDWPSISLFGVILIELSPDRTTCACLRLTYFCFEFKSDLELSKMKWSSPLS